EACAHMQAVTVYPPRLEELIRQRVALIKELARAEAERPRKEAEQQKPQREPFAAFERFGAEIEALFVGAPAAVGNGPGGARAEPQAPPVPPKPALAPVEAELMEAGIVVRGHDIARVVGHMAGTDVEWREDAA